MNNGSSSYLIELASLQNNKFTSEYADITQMHLRFHLALYAGTVMTSLDHVLIPTRSNWFQKPTEA